MRMETTTLMASASELTGPGLVHKSSTWVGAEIRGMLLGDSLRQTWCIQPLRCVLAVQADSSFYPGHPSTTSLLPSF